jgi:hypothetical protein
MEFRMVRKNSSRAKTKVFKEVWGMKNGKKRRRFAAKWVWFLLAAAGGGMAFSGCDQIQEFLGLGGEDEPEPQQFSVIFSIVEGGEVSFIEVAGTTYEIHTFRVKDTTPPGGQEEYELVFDANRPETVEVLVVAGGGGGGMSAGTWHAGGGGAGGYISVQSYPISADPIQIKVGGGGAKAATVGSGSKSAVRGGNGGDSVFGGITAKGGGGGAGHGSGIENTGGNGGSGGGGTYSRVGGTADPGTVTPDDIIPFSVILGKAGGCYPSSNPNGSDAGANGSGGGGGGAGSVGGAPGNGTGALGGIGISSSISGEERWYAGGGTGGAITLTRDSLNPPPEAYGATGGEDGEPGTGDGGSGGGGVADKLSGGSGGSGIVIVRFPR